MNFPRVTIDAGALRENLAVVRRMAPKSRIVAAIKANAYGHGLLCAARALAAADAFGLARIDEALALRAAGVAHRLILLEGVVSPDDLAIAAAQRLDVVVHNLEQVAMLETFPGAQRFEVWLKLDSGMHRLGLAPRLFVEAYGRLKRCKAVSDLRLMTHFAQAEATQDPCTARQIALFNETCAGLEHERSLANSAGVIAWRDAHAEWVRPGLMLYGVSPMADSSAHSLGLRPAMTLATKLIAVNEIERGARVGYGGLWQAARDSRIGVAAIGYGDGYPRSLPNGAPVLVDGREAPLVGRVSMDMIAIDLTEHPAARVDAEVVLWGEGLPIERVAQCAATIGYELACRVSERVRRVETGD